MICKTTWQFNDNCRPEPVISWIIITLAATLPSFLSLESSRNRRTPIQIPPPFLQTRRFLPHPIIQISSNQEFTTTNRTHSFSALHSTTTSTTSPQIIQHHPTPSKMPGCHGCGMPFDASHPSCPRCGRPRDSNYESFREMGDWLQSTYTPGRGYAPNMWDRVPRDHPRWSGYHGNGHR